MFYKKFLYILFFFIISNCTTGTLINDKSDLVYNNNFINKGFALIYDEKLYKQKIVSKKLDDRSLLIFQRNLKKNTTVKITNILNKKTIVAKVGNNSLYPSFNNSVISSRIASELAIDSNEPYIEIISIPKNSMFVAKKAKTYDEEKHVANKVPVNIISVNDLNVSKIKKKEVSKNNFSYIIKIADFYFDKTARLMVERIKIETKIKNPRIQKISNKKYRVYIGPFTNINSLQNSHNDINILGFENIEIIKK
jgi:hypothetical protein